MLLRIKELNRELSSLRHEVASFESEKAAYHDQISDIDRHWTQVCVSTSFHMLDFNLNPFDATVMNNYVSMNVTSVVTQYGSFCTLKLKRLVHNSDVFPQK